jgi:nitrate/TMAO reductase-like tetraheme cytochrome c subunit
MLQKIRDRIIKTFGDIRRFYKSGSRSLRFLKYASTVIILLVILIAAAAEYTSRPAFCPTCHYMETFYQSWRTSAHNKVDCVECHFEPGISGTVRGKLNGLVQIVNYISLSYKKRKPWAEIPDNTCARSGCHETQAFTDSTYNFKGIQFSHKHHLQELKRGKTLKCTSCHSQIVQGTHIEVTASTCFNCHFKKSDDPEHKYDKLSNCTTCHDFKNKTREEMANLRYDHTTVAQNNISCLNCHTNTTAGNGEVNKERCFQCHFENERLDKFDNTEFMHTTHISKHSVRCFTCHNPIDHKIQKIDPSAPPDCKSCHSDAHTSQVSLYTGENGFNVDKNPSIMYLNGINCRGCHIFHETDPKDIKTFKAGETSCEKCHGKGYDRLVDQWREASIKRLATINSIYRTVSYQVNSSSGGNKQEAAKLLDEAFHNIRIVEVGKSVHNVQFADKLLIAGYDLMKQSLTMIGSNVKLPSFESSSEFIPNECYNCHSGIQEISVRKFDMNFSHNQHIVKNRIACAKCHSNAKTHGELIVNKDNCNSCHHSKVNSDQECSKCHLFQNQVYTGSYLNKNQPDFMKAGGVQCIDCHSDAVKIIKPGDKICLKCHDDAYQSMNGEWRDDIKKQLGQANEEIRSLKDVSLDNEQQAVVNDTKKIVNDVQLHPSIYVHNYDLLSSLLSEKIKQLKKFK